MSKDNARNDNVRNEDHWFELIQIRDTFVLCGWEHNQAILILENRGQHAENVEVRYQESQHPTTKLLKFPKQLPPDEPQKGHLPEGFERWEELHFNVGQNPRKPVPIADLITVLKKPHDKIKRKKKPEPLQRGHEPLSPKSEGSTDFEKQPHLSSFQVVEERQSDPLIALDEFLAAVKRKSRANEQLSPEPEHKRDSTPSYEKSVSPLKHDQNQQENTISKLQNKITELEQITTEHQKEIERVKKQKAELSQENSELKRLLDTQTEIRSSDPEQTFREAGFRVLRTLFEKYQKEIGEISQDPTQICEDIETEIKRFEAQFDGEMIYTLSVVKERLTEVKGIIHFELSELSSPEKLGENRSEQLAQLVLMDAPPDEVQFPYLGELGKIYWNDLKVFTTKIPQVIVETQMLLNRIVIQLLDGFSPYRANTGKEEQMSRCFYEDYLPHILQTMSLELIPIEIGQTEADSRIHDIQGSQRGAYRRGVVADIIQYGIRRISDKQIIRKPVVMRGEPE